MPTDEERRTENRRQPHNECEHPSCHEAMKMCIHKMLPKQTAWILFVVIGLPFLITGVKVWSQQESSDLRFADKERVMEIEKDHAAMSEIVGHIKQDLGEIRREQVEARKDIKLILRKLAE